MAGKREPDAIEKLTNSQRDAVDDGAGTDDDRHPHLRGQRLDAFGEAARAKLWLAAIILFICGFLIVGVSFLPSVEGFNDFLTYVLRQAGTALLVSGVAAGLIRIFRDPALPTV